MIRMIETEREPDVGLIDVRIKVRKADIGHILRVDLVKGLTNSHGDESRIVRCESVQFGFVRMVPSTLCIDRVEHAVEVNGDLQEIGVVCFHRIKRLEVRG